MTTVLLLVLCSAIGMAVFVWWVKTHAPEGYEDDERGFIFSGGSPAAEAIKGGLESTPSGAKGWQSNPAVGG